MATAVCFGEIVVDEYRDRRVPAGAPFHVAAHLVSLGWDALLCTAVGTDEDGDLLVRAVEKAGVGTSLIERNLLPSGLVRIEIGADGHEFEIATPAAWDAISGPTALPEHEVFYFGTLAARNERNRAVLLRLLGDSSAPWKVCDVNLRPPFTPTSLVVELTAEASVVKVSADEQRVLGCDRTEDLLRLGPRVRYAVTTLGEGGARLIDRTGSQWVVPGKRMEVVDTVGAGDAFTAGLIHGLAAGADPIDALTAARDRSAATVGYRGGLPT